MFDRCNYPKRADKTPSSFYHLESRYDSPSCEDGIATPYSVSRYVSPDSKDTTTPYTGSIGRLVSPEKGACTPYTVGRHVYHKRSDSFYSPVLLATCDNLVLQSRHSPVVVDPPDEMDELSRALARLALDDKENQNAPGSMAAKATPSASTRKFFKTPHECGLVFGQRSQSYDNSNRTESLVEVKRSLCLHQQES